MALAISLALAAAASPATAPSAAIAGAQPPVTLRATARQLLELARRLERSGDKATAKNILAAVASDPSSDVRNEARFQHARLLIAEGQGWRAALLLRRIIDERPDAVPVRLQLAGLLDKIGDKDGAWRQLRAIHAGGLPVGVARIVDRYSEALRAQRPLGASLELTLAPDSNINRATRSDTLGTVFGDFDISRNSKARSGTGLSLHAQAYRRLAVGQASMLIRVAGAADLYRRKEFNDVAADVAVGPEISLGRNRLEIELGATQRWFGQKPFLRSARIAAIVSHPIGGRILARLSGSAGLVDNQVNDLQDGKSLSGQIGVEWALTPTIGIAATFGIDRQALKDPGYSTRGWRAGFTAWHDIGRMTLTAGVDLGRLSADKRLLLFPQKRVDRYSRLSFGATFRQLQLHGFAPVARFSIEHNKSSVAVYDYRRTRTEIGIARAF